jgi:hypothetical protein
MINRGGKLLSMTLRIQHQKYLMARQKAIAKVIRFGLERLTQISEKRDR